VDGTPAACSRLLEACWLAPPRHQHDDDPDTDMNRGHDWCRNINVRGCPFDDLQWGRDRGVHHHTRSPRSHRGVQRHGAVDKQFDVHGRSMSCSLGRRRARQALRRDDEGWDRRHSVSPARPMFHQHSARKA
jgi:hypothetical protein